MKKILFCLCAVAMTSWFTACKDDDDAKVANEFTLENNKYALSAGYADSVGTETVGDKVYHFWDVVVVSSGITYNSSEESFTGIGDAVRFDIYTTQDGSTVPEGTYTAGGTDNGVENAMVFINVNTTSGGGTIYDNEIDDAEVKISKSGSSHIITFTLTLDDARVIKGSFKGTLTAIDSF